MMMMTIVIVIIIIIIMLGVLETREERERAGRGDCIRRGPKRVIRHHGTSCHSCAELLVFGSIGKCLIIYIKTKL
jgi:hypothetical protein